VGLGVLGALLIYHATAWGPWAFSDATGYLTATRNLIAGHGIGGFDPRGNFSPLVSHPPLYVLVLGGVSLLGLDPIDAARAVDVLLFGALIGVSGLLMYRLLSSLQAGLALAALLLVHPALIIAYTSAMAEPPFILLGLISLLLLAESLLRRRLVPFLAAALAAGGALLSRYPGAAFVLTGVAAIMLWGDWPPKLRLQRAGLFSIIGALPVGVFLLWAFRQPNTEGPRALGGRLEVPRALLQFGRSAADAAWSWKPVPPAVLLPDRLGQLISPEWVSGSLAAVGFVGLLLLVYGSLRWLPAPRLGSRTASPAGIVFKVLALFTIIYLTFFAAAYLATDPTPDVDSRTLLPLLPALLGMAIAFVRLTSDAWKGRPALRAGWIGLLLAALAGYAVISQDIVVGLHHTGLGYTGRDWRNSATIAAVRGIPHELALISNEPYAVLLLTGRTPYTIYEIAQQDPAESYARFGSGETEAEQLFLRGQARLVLFESIHDQFDMLYDDRADERYQAFISGLIVLTQTEDGTVYGYPGASSIP
jgi:4-amino-4-deoxy-L-arabinose transferase-like glycosyltransferase